MTGGGGLWDALLAPMPATLRVYGTIIGAFALRLIGRLPRDDGVLQRLLIDVLFPLFIVDNLLGREAFDEPHELALPPLIGFLTVVGGYGLGLLAARAMPAALGLGSDGARRAFAVTVGMANYGYLPIPLAQELERAGRLPAATVETILVHNVGVDLALWSAGVLIISGGFAAGWWRRLVNVPLITIALVLGLNLLGVRRDTPGIDWLLATAGFLGAAAIPVALVMTGIVIAEVWDQADWRRGWRTMLGGAALRLLVIPAAVMAAAVLLPAGQGPLRATLVVQASMPAALFPIVLSRIYGADAATAVRVSVTTALLAFVTIPLWLALGLWLIG